jgi:transposase-like protein
MKERVMQASVLDAKHFHDEEAAYAYLEARLWPNGPVCPRCGHHDRIGKMGGKSTRIGVYKCYQCRKPFRVTVGTVFEASHVPLRLWLQCVHLMASSKKGISSNQLSRTLGVTLKTAWFMSHRVREAMKVLGMEPMGGAGKIVESDETFIGRVEGKPKGRAGAGHKNAVLTLVERGGSARSFHLDNVKMESTAPVVLQNVLVNRHAKRTPVGGDRHPIGTPEQRGNIGFYDSRKPRLECWSWRRLQRFVERFLETGSRSKRSAEIWAYPAKS